VVIRGQVTDCRFPLPAGTLDPWLGPHVADEDVSYDDENDNQADCTVEGSPLVGVFAFYEPGERVVRPRISGEFSSATATFTTVDGSDYPVNLSPDLANEPYVFGYNPLRVWKYGTASAEPGLARVWLRDDPSVSWTVNLPAAAPDGIDPVEIDVGGLAPGRYRITPCIGDTPEACEEVPGGVTFQVGTGRLEELIPGWNRPHADRINVVLAPSGQVTLDDARATARDLVAWDGPLLVSDEDTLLGSDGPSRCGRSSSGRSPSNPSGRRGTDSISGSSATSWRIPRRSDSRLRRWDRVLRCPISVCPTFR
jgi:hypothetical protein